tara:strand:- start:2287 stop:2742 length:456 start_codon:yes stop_codon:yes gene_type:complete
MASLDALISSLNTVANSLQKTTSVILKKQERFIVRVLQRRLLEKGTDANDKLIGGGQYAEATIRHKLFTGQTTSHFTLFDTGDFHKAMRVDLVGDMALITSGDSKTSELMFRYGEDILGLTEEETDEAIRLFVDPLLQKEINSITPRVIKI